MDFDFTEPYLRKVLGFMGMTDITAFRIEGVNYPGAGDPALTKALDEAKQYSF